MSILGLGFQKQVADFFSGKTKPIVLPYGKNIFNKNALIDGKYIDNTGAEYTLQGWKCTDYIWVVGGQKLIASHYIGDSSLACIVCYDENKNMLTYINQIDFNSANRILTLPINCEYVRFSLSGSADDTVLQIEYGTVSTEYEDFNSMPRQLGFQNPISVNVDKSVEIRTKPAFNEFSNISFPYGKNIFNKNALIDGKYINNTGAEYTSGTWKCTDYIPVIPGSKLVVSSGGVSSSPSAGTAYYDKDKLFISFVSNATIISSGNKLNVPKNAYYFRFSIWQSTDISNLQIEYGTVSTAYEDFSALPTLPDFRNPQSVSIQNSIGIESLYKQGGFSGMTFPHGKNLFNKDTAVDGVLIRNTGEERPNSTGWFSSDFIPVIQNSKLKFNSLTGNSTDAGTAFYDSDKTFMSFVSLSEIKSNGLVVSVPKNAALLRFCDFGLSRKNTIQLEYGVITTSYEEYSPIPRMPIIENIKITNDLLPFEKILNSNSLDIYKDTTGSLHACFRNVYVRYDGDTFYIYNNGLKENPSLVTFNSTSFPGLISGSRPIRIFILPFSRNATSSFPGRDWRLNVVTSKGQVYHNFPSRNTTSDGTAQANDYMLFDEGCIWELPERWAPVKTNTGSDADLIATGKYRYFPALAEAAYTLYPAVNQDNGYGNGGFPAVLEKTNQSGETVKFARFHQPVRVDIESVSLDFMGGLVVNEKLCAIGTYRSNTANQGARICVFYTNDGGRNWFCRYEFGAAGQLINSSDAQLKSPVTNHIPHDLFVDSPSAGANLFQIIKRSQYTPTADVKEPTNKFKYSSPVPVSSITAASNKITVVTGSAHGLVSGDIILFEKQSGADSNEWDWLVNSGHNSNSAGDGLIFKVVVVNSTSFTLKQEIHNPHNNLTCRHIHSLNKSPHGITIGCGETYPNGWILLHNYFASDSFYTLLPWDTFNYIRLTSSNVAAQRPLGFLLKHDGTYLIGMDNESTNIGNIALPTGRTGDGIRKSSTGVYKGNITNVDDLGQAECVLESNEVAYFFQEINGVILFIGQLGEMGISSDGGETWIRWKIDVNGLSRFSGAMNDRMFMVQNHLFHVKE
jgi:hypothetical protein